METLAYTHFAMAEVYEVRKDIKDSDAEFGEALQTYKQLIPNPYQLTGDEIDADAKADADRVRWNEWMIALKLHKDVGQVPYFPGQYPSCKKMVSVR